KRQTKRRRRTRPNRKTRRRKPPRRKRKRARIARRRRRRRRRVKERKDEYFLSTHWETNLVSPLDIGFYWSGVSPVSKNCRGAGAGKRSLIGCSASTERLHRGVGAAGVSERGADLRDGIRFDRGQ